MFRFDIFRQFIKLRYVYNKQVLIYLLAPQMGPINLACILLDTQCLESLFPHSLVALLLSLMPFQLVELFMDQLGQCLMFPNLGAEVLVLDEAMPVLLLAVIFPTSKGHSNLLEQLDLPLTFLLWIIQILSRLLGVHYPNLDSLIMFVLLHFLFLCLAPFLHLCCSFLRVRCSDVTDGSSRSNPNFP